MPLSLCVCFVVFSYYVEDHAKCISIMLTCFGFMLQADKSLGQKLASRLNVRPAM